MRCQKAFGLDRKVSTICLGTGLYGSQLSEKTSFKLLDRFAAAGGNFIDTAHIYGAWDPEGANGGCGNSEALIGPRNVEQLEDSLGSFSVKLDANDLSRLSFQL